MLAMTTYRYSLMGIVKKAFWAVAEKKRAKKIK
jgi:hypothetical protein